MIWFRSANSRTVLQLHRCIIKAGQMAASDYVPNFFTACISGGVHR